MTILNGQLVPLLSFAVMGLLGIVNVLIAFIVRLHMKSDDADQQRTGKELDRLRDRVHDYGNRVSAIETQLRWMREDK
jgi:hypothetical protein